MKKEKIIFYFVFLLSITSLISCSSFIYTETNNQPNYNTNHIFFDVRWTLKSIKISDYEKLSFPLYGQNSTLTFSSSGSYSGKAICNTFFGKCIAEENNIKFSNATMTRVGCQNNIEELIMNTLSDTNNYTLYDKKLYLKRNSEVLMIYELNE